MRTQRSVLDDGSLEEDSCRVLAKREGSFTERPESQRSSGRLVGRQSRKQCAGGSEGAAAPSDRPCGDKARRTALAPSPARAPCGQFGATAAAAKFAGNLSAKKSSRGCAQTAASEPPPSTSGPSSEAAQAEVLPLARLAQTRVARRPSDGGEHASEAAGGTACPFAAPSGGGAQCGRAGWGLARQDATLKAAVKLRAAGERQRHQYLAELAAPLSGTDGAMAGVRRCSARVSMEVQAAPVHAARPTLPGSDKPPRSSNVDDLDELPGPMPCTQFAAAAAFASKLGKRASAARGPDADRPRSAQFAAAAAFAGRRASQGLPVQAPCCVPLPDSEPPHRLPDTAGQPGGAPAQEGTLSWTEARSESASHGLRTGSNWI